MLARKAVCIKEEYDRGESRLDILHAAHFFYICSSCEAANFRCALYHIPGRSSSLFCDFSKNMKSIRKHAPSITAFIETSKSMGNDMPAHCVCVYVEFSARSVAVVEAMGSESR